MNYVAIWSYDNYVPAHLAKGRLEEEGIHSWLKDENTVTIDPILTNAVGGIKLMVRESEAGPAFDILNKLREEYRASLACPHCGSHDLEWISSTRKPSSWIGVIGTWILGDLALASDQRYHCFNCKKEFAEAVPSDTSGDKGSDLSS